MGDGPLQTSLSSSLCLGVEVWQQGSPPHRSWASMAPWHCLRSRRGPTELLPAQQATSICLGQQRKRTAWTPPAPPFLGTLHGSKPCRESSDDAWAISPDSVGAPGRGDRAIRSPSGPCPTPSFLLSGEQ